MGETALIRAVSHGHLEVVTILLKAKVDKEQQDNVRHCDHVAINFKSMIIVDDVILLRCVCSNVGVLVTLPF